MFNKHITFLFMECQVKMITADNRRFPRLFLSLYAHYKSKDELFLAVFEDVSREHGMLFERLLEGSKGLGTIDKLHYHFEEYILYFLRNTETQVFSNMSLFHIPRGLHEKLRSSYLDWEKGYRKNLEDIFREGMRQGIIRKGDPGKKVWSFKTKRDGVAAWLSVSPELDEEFIGEFWNDFVNGII